MIPSTLRAAVACSLACSFSLTFAACSGESAPASNPTNDGGTREPVSDGGTREAASEGTTIVASNVARDTAPVVTTEDAAAFRAGNQTFAFKLYDTLRDSGAVKADQNAVFSPVSISIALSMAYAGAKGATADAMADALEYRIPKERLFPAFDGLDLALNARGDEAFNTDRTRYPNLQPASYRVHLVNAFWGEKTLTFETPFLDTLARSYGAGVRLADFKHNHDAERIKINDWVSDETNGKIKDLIPADMISSDTTTVLVNGIHVKLPWADRFSIYADAPFSKVDGAQVTVPFIGKEANFGYAAKDGLQAVSVPLAGGALKLLVVAPKAGELASFEATLGNGGFDTIVQSLKVQDVFLRLPKVDLQPAGMKLAEALKSLGMAVAFDNAADFSGITSHPTKISEVLHKATLAYDENGLEAAAATAVVFGDAGASPIPPPQPVPFMVDRPYFMAVYDAPTGAILFAGHVTDPSAH